MSQNGPGPHQNESKENDIVEKCHFKSEIV